MRVGMLGGQIGTALSEGGRLSHVVDKRYTRWD
jgi:hypothetical protein